MGSDGRAGAAAGAGREAGPLALDAEVTDYLIEQVVIDIESCEHSAAAKDDAAAGAEELQELRTSLREAAEQLLVHISSHHMAAVLTRLLSRLDGASMFQQQKAQAAARFALRSRAGAQWFSDKDARPTGGDHRLVSVLSAVEAVASRSKATQEFSKHFKKVLAALLPVIGLATSPASKEAWSRTMCACCDAVSAHDQELRASEQDGEEAGDSSTRLAMLAGYDVLASSWSSSTDARVQLSAFLALAAMTTSLPAEDRRQRVPTVITKLCQILTGVNSTMSVRVCLGDEALQEQVRTHMQARTHVRTHERTHVRARAHTHTI